MWKWFLCWSWFQLPNQVINLHMSRKLSCGNMCKILIWSFFVRQEQREILKDLEHDLINTWWDERRYLLSNNTIHITWPCLHCRTMVLYVHAPMQSLQWRHNESDGISRHRRLDCLLNRLFSANQRNIEAPRHWPLWGEFTGDRWIPRRKGH